MFFAFTAAAGIAVAMALVIGWGFEQRPVTGYCLLLLFIIWSLFLLGIVRDVIDWVRFG